MNHQIMTISADENLPLQNAEHFQLRGAWLKLARLGWFLISLSTVGLCITALTWNTVTWWHLTTATCNDAQCLAQLRIFGSFHVVAIYFGLGAIVEMFPWVLVGLLIFWRKSQDLFALLFSLGMVLTGIFLLDDVVQRGIWNHFPAFRFPVDLLDALAWVMPIL